MRQTIIILLLLGFLLPNFAFTQEEDLITAPETFEEVKELGEKALEVGERELPGTLERIWQEEVLPIWQKMYDWFKDNIWPKVENWYITIIKPKAEEEIEKRKPEVEEELQKEKEEMKTEGKELGKSLWEKFKEIIK